MFNNSDIHPFFIVSIRRSSHRRCSIKKDVLRNSVKFAGKHLRQSLFFSKVAGLRRATLLKKTPWRRCFPVNFGKFLRTPFLQTRLDDCFQIWILFSVLRFDQSVLHSIVTCSCSGNALVLVMAVAYWMNKIIQAFFGKLRMLLKYLRSCWFLIRGYWFFFICDFTLLPSSENRLLSMFST